MKKMYDLFVVLEDGEKLSVTLSAESVKEAENLALIAVRSAKGNGAKILNVKVQPKNSDH